MYRYVISYDLRKPDYTEEDYEDLWNELRTIGAKHIQDSVWAITSELNAKQIFDALRQHMHKSDRLLVAATDGTDWQNVNGVSKFGDA